MKAAIKCPTFAIISVASDGDVNAIESILRHYDAYISKASVRPFYDEYGQMYLAIDHDLKGLIRTALVTKMMKFEVEFEVA